MNIGLNVYPEISSKKFYESINSKKEFYQNRISNKREYECFQPNQILLSNFINPLTQYNSLLVYAQTGVGKTGTAISISEKFIKEKYKIIVIVKNKLLELNFRNELLYVCSNYTNPDMIINNQNINRNYSFITNEILVSSTLGNAAGGIRRKNLSNHVVIVDEVHNITGNNGYTALLKLLQNSKNTKVVLLSATPIYDNVIELFELSNILNFDNKDLQLPIKTQLYKNELIKRKISDTEIILNDNVNILTPKGKELLKMSLKGKISYLTVNTKDFPSKTFIGTKISGTNSFSVFKTVMSPFQTTVYNEKINGKNNGLFKEATNASIIVYPDSTTDTIGFKKNIIKKSRDFLKYENVGKYSCKFKAILEQIKKSNGTVFIYSNLVNNNGTELLEYLLLENGYSSYLSRRVNLDKPTFVVIGNIKTSKRRINIVNKFNDPENSHGKNIKIIIGSPMIAEGLTFKYIRQIHILDPYWNFSKIDQIIGRGVRYLSHDLLPVSERNVQIFLHVAIPDQTKTQSIDLLKYILSQNKDYSIKEAEYLLKTIAIDCSLNKSRNYNKSSLDNSRECQYTTCDYKCEGKSKSTNNQIDSSTYQIEYHDPTLYNFIYNKLISLFKKGYVFSLPDIIRYINEDKKTLDICNENIYYVLNNIIDKEIIGINSIKGTIIHIGNDIYVFNPNDTQIRTQLFDKIIKQIKTIKLIRGKTNTKNKSPIRKIISLTPNKISQIKKNNIYGTLLDKNNKRDNTFRIVLNTNKSKNLQDKRNVVHGKTCVLYTKQELLDIINKLNIQIPKDIPIVKISLCLLIKEHLVSNKKIVS